MPHNHHRRNYPFRVFLSYAHEDASLVEQVAELLKTQGLVPVWDREIRTGLEFTDEIKRLIATAHVFMPLITPQSKGKPWVHQEIGFANGIDLPVVPAIPCLVSRWRPSSNNWSQGMAV